MTYPGGKNGAGVYQNIINRMPPHEVYIEPFLGGGAVMRLKKPALLNIGLDLDTEALFQFSRCLHTTPSETAWAPIAPIVQLDDSRSLHAVISVARGSSDPTMALGHLNAFDFLRRYPFTGNELVYCDPPYMHSTRGRADRYRFELTDNQHSELLTILKALPCRVMLSGYWTLFYEQKLSGWATAHFQTTNRAGKKTTEWLWFNFPEPVALHDYRYLGKDFRERERIKRKKARWVAKLENMPVLERRALLCAIEEAWNGDVRRRTTPGMPILSAESPQMPAGPATSLNPSIPAAAGTCAHDDVGIAGSDGGIQPSYPAMVDGVRP